MADDVTKEAAAFLTPPFCPVCEKPMGGKILVCVACWDKLTPPQRHPFVRDFARAQRARNWKLAKSSGLQVINLLKRG